MPFFSCWKKNNLSVIDTRAKKPRYIVSRWYLIRKYQKRSSHRCSKTFAIYCTRKWNTGIIIEMSLGYIFVQLTLLPELRSGKFNGSAMQPWRNSATASTPQWNPNILFTNNQLSLLLLLLSYICNRLIIIWYCYAITPAGILIQSSTPIVVLFHWLVFFIYVYPFLWDYFCHNTSLRMSRPTSLILG